MADLCLAALQQLRDFLLAVDGVNVALAEIGAREVVHLAPLKDETVLIQNLPADLAEENLAVVYPALYLYCDRMDNSLLERFTAFSGAIFLVIDVRVSGERPVGLDSELARYVEAVRSVLEAHHGQWTENLAYNGAYKVQFGPIQLGGRNFIQTAQIEAELQGHA